MARFGIRQSVAALFCLTLALATTNAFAEDAKPVPAPTVSGPSSKGAPDPNTIAALGTLIKQGATVTYMGNDFGLNAWLAIHGPDVQTLYTTPDGRAVVLGILFGSDGANQTQNQLTNLQQASPEVAQHMAEAIHAARAATDTSTPQSPGEHILADAEHAAWIGTGSADKPVMYVVADPLCHFCHAYWDELYRDYISTGKANIRIIMIGSVEPDSAKTAAALLSNKSADEAWIHFLGGDQDLGKGETSDVGTTALARNTDFMNQWKITHVPFSIYRNTQGKVMIVSGPPVNMAAIMADLGAH